MPGHAVLFMQAGHRWMSAAHKFVETAGAGLCASGAYALLIELETPLRVNAGAKRARLAPGLYVYCGSARGPGGVAARLARHMRRDKRAHWHVDQLTSVGKVLGAWVFPGWCECEVNEDLATWPMPLDGFGSSDCRRCRAHLRFWPPGAPQPGEWESPPRRQGASARVPAARLPAFA
jgi:Uri superfamily endonuclease